jgi:hypothetical protein
MDLIRSLWALPRMVVRIFLLVRENYAIAVLDQNLAAFLGSHLDPDNPVYRSRPWVKVDPRRILATQLRDVSVPAAARFTANAIEIEDPIVMYTEEGGESLRYVLPALARYLGKTSDQMAYAKKNNLPWCESVWCAEERRHAPALALIFKSLTGAAIKDEQPNTIAAFNSSEKYALQLLLSRETTEWAAAAGYLVMAAHAVDELQQMYLNITRDEIRHLAVASASRVYIQGFVAKKRFREMVGQMLAFVKHHGERSELPKPKSVSLAFLNLESALTLLISEFFVRKWLRTVPLATLRLVFEVETKLRRPASEALDEAVQSSHREFLEAERAKRVALSRWAPELRAVAERDAASEARLAPSLNRFAQDSLAAFAGASRAGSPADRAIRRKIARAKVGASPEDWSIARKILVARLRHHQFVSACPFLTTTADVHATSVA